MSEPVLIKKYANRRLYDTESSAYVTLGKVEEMVKNGRAIKVIDAKTHEDVTAFILTQIILEASKNHVMLPVSLLHLIIRYGDNLLSEFFEEYFEETLKIYLHSKSAFDHHFREWLKIGMNFPGMDSSFFNINPFANMLNFFHTQPGKAEQTEDADENDET